MRALCVAAAMAVFFLLCFPVSAEWDYGEIESAVPDSARGLLDGYRATSEAGTGLEKLKNALKEHLSDAVKEALRPAAGICAVIVICSAFTGLAPEKRELDYVSLGGCLAIAVLCLGDVGSVLKLGEKTVTELSDFSRVLLPTLSAAAAASGAAGSAAAKYAATALFVDVLISAANGLVFPAVRFYCAAVLAEAILGDRRISGAVKLLMWVSKTVLVGIVTVFTFYLSVTGVVAASADAFAGKAAKTAISAALPVVGKIVSDAADSIVAGAGIIKSTAGVFGLIIVLGVCLMPFLRLGVRYVVFKAASAVAEAADSGRIVRLIKGIGGAYGLILGAVGAEAIFIYISIFSLIKAVGT